jgi:tetratricopeptide (TPR) repeat protein
MRCAKWIGLSWGIMLGVSLAFSAQRAEGSALRSLRWAERLLAATPVPPTHTHPSGTRWGLGKAEEAFASIIRRYGGSARAYLGLGRCQMRLGEYGPALRSFTRAKELWPTDMTTMLASREAQEALKISRAVAAQLPRNQKVVQLLRVPSTRTMWAILSAEVGNRGGFRPISDPHLLLFEKTASGCRKLWQSGVLCGGNRDEELPGSWNEVALKVGDLTGDGVPKVAVWKMVAGGNWANTHLDLFTLRCRRLVKVTGFSSDGLIWIEDLNHDFRVEIGTCRLVGLDMLHWARPKWGDIYAWKSGRYVLADSDFSCEYHGVASELAATVPEYPHDPEVREYLGRAREVERRPRAALTAYRSALSLYRSLYGRDNEPWYQSKVGAIGARIAAVRLLTRQRRPRA